MAGGRAPASPKARRLAAENNLDLAQVTGSGPDGAVLTNDIQNMLARLSLQQAEEIPGLSIAARAEVVEEIAMSRKWQIMVQRLGEAWHNIPHFYLKREVDAGQLIAWRESARQRAAEKITYTDLLVKLTASALKKHPRANASWLNNQIVANQGVHVGLAVAVDDGLMVPVIHQANELSLGQIARRRTELVIAAQEDRLSLADLEGGTFTISNLGMFGTDEFSAIVNPPQAAILAVGRIVDRVVPVNDQPGVRPMMTLTLSCDHRVIDGARGAQFLETIAQWIEEPLALLD
jgi:pyruvate dehydrogenase E2 component (dihydrolipoamide acetyltransferase)